MEPQADSELVILGKQIICALGTLGLGVDFPFSKVGCDSSDIVSVKLWGIKRRVFCPHLG